MDIEPSSLRVSHNSTSKLIDVRARREPGWWARSKQQVSSLGSCGAALFDGHPVGGEATLRSSTLLVHSLVTARMLWDTNVTVLPSFAMSFIRPKHVAWKSRVIDAHGLIDQQDLWFGMCRIRDADRIYIPLEYLSIGTGGQRS